MDKQIDIEQCEFWQEGHCSCYETYAIFPHCIEYPNCYYKQLENVRQQYFKLLGTNISLEEQYEQYKKSKQLSYESEQKRANQLELENRKLENKLQIAVNALERIENPILAMRNEVPQGSLFNGYAAVEMMKNPNYYIDIATTALTQISSKGDNNE